MQNKLQSETLSVKLNRILFISIMVILLFQDILGQRVPILYYADEIIALFCIPCICMEFIKREKGKNMGSIRSRLEMLVLLLAFLLYGLCGNIIYQYQPWDVVLISVVLSSKFFMIILTAGFIQRNAHLDLSECERTYEILAIALFGYSLFSMLFPGHLVKPSQWDLCAKAAVLCGLLIFANHKNALWNKMCVLLMLALLVLSGKEKAYAAIMLFALLFYLLVQKKVRAKLIYIFFMAIPVILIAWNKIDYYYIQGHDRYAKSIMTETSLKIARDYFPFGTGFGTFASTYAAKHYSPVYFLYGLAENAELGVDSRLYLNDYFWQLVLGETGILGAILYCGMILLLFCQIQKLYHYDKKRYFLLIFLFIFVLMTTFSEAGFMDPLTMIYAFVIGVLLEEYDQKRDKKLKYLDESEQE